MCVLVGESPPNRRVVEPMISRGKVWPAIAALVVVVGTAASILSAQAVGRNDSQKARQTAITSSVEIAGTLKLAIQREQDLAVGAGAFAMGNPNASQAEFRQWVISDRVFQRYPELSGIGELAYVPAADLTAFAARVQTDPSSTSASTGTFQVSPPGSRPYYCFQTLSQSRTGGSTTPEDYDLCSSALGSSLMSTRSSGQGTYLPYGTGKATTLVVGTPIYAGGATPPTVQARQSAFIGWVGIQVQPSTVLATSLVGHSATAVAFSHQNGATTATFTDGTVPAGAKATTIELPNGWSVKVLAVADGSSIIRNANALALLLSGILLSLLLGLLIYILGTSRSRAVVLVEERTDQLRHQALHDSLTGLPNRALILDRIEQMLARGRRQHYQVAALFLDLDDFKDINDTLGHRAGDELLVSVGARLASALREGDTVGRLGGDEFVVLSEGASLDAGAELVADRILDVLATPFEIASSDVPLIVTASVGVAQGDRTTPEELLQDADIALYQAKAAGKQRAVSFSPSMQAAVDDHRHLEVDLQTALEGGEFFLVYQPTIDLSTGDFTGGEALLRWRHPTRGVVQPDNFIPALESSGLIVTVGAWVLHEACRQGAAWNRQGYRFMMSVNVSGRQLERDRIIDDVSDALQMSGLEPEMLILELTETALMHDVEAAITRLKLLKALGVRIAIDDFGTGYSSLAYLRQFPIDVLKIDRSFVSGIADTSESAALMHTLVQLGKTLGLETIAEGIETDDQRSRLQAEEVEIGQGFLFARPLAVDDMNRLLRSSAGKGTRKSKGVSHSDPDLPQATPIGH
jgi:diguanylate cyclase (GGDEF)-like protein